MTLVLLTRVCRMGVESRQMVEGVEFHECYIFYYFLKNYFSKFVLKIF